MSNCNDDKYRIGFSQHQKRISVDIRVDERAKWQLIYENGWNRLLKIVIGMLANKIDLKVVGSNLDRLYSDLQRHNKTQKHTCNQVFEPKSKYFRFVWSVTT